MRIELVDFLKNPERLARAFGAKLKKTGVPPSLIVGIATDSREIQPGDLFVVLKGEKSNGADYIPEALAAGAVALLMPAEQPLPCGDFYAFCVPNVLASLLFSAAYRRRHTKATVIAVSGSTGKTTVKEAIADVLRMRGSVSKSEGNFNSNIGLPLSLLGMPEADYFVIEIGISHPGEMAPLATAVRPHIGVLTNVGSAHLGNFRSSTDLAKEKAALAIAMGADGILLVDEMIDGKNFTGYLPRQLSVGNGCHADVCAIPFENGSAGVCADISVRGKVYSNMHWPLPGRIGNSVLAFTVAVGHFCGLSEADIKIGLQLAGKNTPRMKVIRLGERVLLDDTYNASPEAVIEAIETARLLAQSRPLVVVLGDMGELGINARSLHRYVGAAAVHGGAASVWCYGSFSSDIAAGARTAGMMTADIRCFMHKEGRELACALTKYTPSNALILFKASRKTALDRVIQYMQNDALPNTMKDGIKRCAPY